MLGIHCWNIHSDLCVGTFQAATLHINIQFDEIRARDGKLKRALVMQDSSYVPALPVFLLNVHGQYTVSVCIGSEGACELPPVEYVR